MPGTCWLIPGEKPAGTSNRLLRRTPADTGRLQFLSSDLRSSACCLPAKGPVLSISETYCVAFLAGSWRSGPLGGWPGSHWVFLEEGDTLGEGESCRLGMGCRQFWGK